MKRVLAGLVGSAPSFLLGKEIVNQPERSRLILTPTLKEAEDRVEELRCFLPKEISVILYPPWESKPFDYLSPSLETIAERIGGLWRLYNEPAVVVAPIGAAMQRVIPREELFSNVVSLAPKDLCDLEELREKLELLGYRFQEQITTIGEVAIRGNIVDIFPPTLSSPVRIEFFDIEIETIRTLDIATQRSGTAVKKLNITPVREVLLTEESIKLGQKSIKENADAIGIPKSTRDPWSEQLQERIMIPEVEGWLPFFYERLSTIFDFLPPDGSLVFIDQARILEEAASFEETCKEMREKSLHEPRLVPTLDSFYLTTKEIEKICSEKAEIQIESLVRQDLDSFEEIKTEPIIGVAPKSQVRTTDPLAPLVANIKKWKNNGNHIIFAVHTEEQATRLRELLAPHGFETRRISGGLLPAINALSGAPKIVNTIIGAIDRGFIYPKEHLILMSEEEVFGIRRRRRTKKWKEPASAAFFATLEELKEGDPVVHVEHGIGRYEGLEQIAMDGVRKDFLLISYKGGDRLFLPVHRVNLLQKYLGDASGRARLDQLGGQAWDRRKKRVNKAVKDLAEGLLKLYAKRETVKGIRFSAPDSYFLEFEGTFEFEETEDQQQAIDDVIEDMCSSKPMDRLVCGDVGYGKTEVAIRAAFKAVADQKQVAILCPTTLLVSQHEQTFKERFADFPVIVEQLSRFKTPTQRKQILENVKNGEVDVIIGTHALLSKRVKFHNLGLVVIDEEQRFGVSQKERLKELRTEVDILTMTATPIPRTMSLSLGGIRDLSIINTPPVDRHTIQTFVTPFHTEVIRSVVLEELKRGGGKYFLSTIEWKQSHLLHLCFKTWYQK
ncbi:DEAD/DEAH box helicase [Bdellovibrionota bacterium]